MQTIFDHLPGVLKISAQASMLILLVLAVQWILGPRLQPRWRCALWLLVMLRLALPSTISSPTSVFNLIKLPAPAPTAPAVIPPATTISEPLAVSPSVASPTHSQPSHRLNWLALSWAAGALALLGFAAVNHYKLHRRIVRQRPLLDGPTLSLLEDCKSLMGVNTPVTLIETDAVQSPTLFGFIRPRLLLPAGLVSNFSSAELRHIFLHELAHLKRRDILAGWGMLLLQAVHWFNPLVWFAFYRMRADRELACDALALSCAPPGEHKCYGLTILKLMESFGQSGWAPSLAGILESKQQIKERIHMIAKFQKTKRGFALALCLFIGFTLAALTDAQNAPKPATPPPVDPPAKAEKTQTSTEWNLEEKTKLAEAGNQSVAYELFDAYYRGKHGVTIDAGQAAKWLDQFIKGVWVVRFTPVGDFAPGTPGEFLGRISQYTTSRSGKTNIGAASFFRTTRDGKILLGSFLTIYPDALQADLAKVPGVKVTGAEPMTAGQFIQYEASPQESLPESARKWDLQEKIKLAQTGNQWAAYELWDAYYRGKRGVTRDQAQADKWLAEVVKDLWVVRFEPVDDFAPATPREFLAKISEYAQTFSGRTNIGAASFFRTTRQDGKLLGSFLSNYPDELKAGLAKVPGVKVTSTKQITPEEFIKYEESPQQSLSSR